MKIIIRNSFTAFSMLIALSLGNSAQAIPMMETLGVVVSTGPGSGETGSIVVSYDSDDLTGTGNETLNQSMISLALTLFGQSFTNNDDVDFASGTFPTVSWTDGTINFINYIISETDPDNPTAITDPRIGRISGGTVSQGVWQVDTSEAEAVPEPATIALFGLGVAGLGWSRRRKV